MKINNNEEYKYKRIQVIDSDSREVLGNTLLKNDGSEELVLNVINKKQAEGFKRKLEKDKKKELLSLHISENEGSYFHLIYKYGYPILDKLQSKCEGNKSNIHIVRFIQLATYVAFGGRLFDKNNNEIKKSSLSKIWDTTNRNSVNETYNLLKECNYISETKEGYIMISKDLIVKGAIEDFKKLRKQDTDLTYTRIFSENIQSMYEGTEPKARKQLANLFKALPYINFKYNVFCLNPTEIDETKLELLKWTDLARLCGYEEKKHITKFKKDLWTIRVNGYDTIGEFKTQSGMAICINPKVYFSGDNVDDVQRLYAMFSMCQSQK